MIIKTAEFVKSATNPSQYPEELLPEIAFVGRSNVGKSSLINTLVNRRQLVKTSSTPGRTQLINFFDINSTFSFVDLPGYGYAKVPASVRKNWGPMIETYLSGRKTLKGAVMILDLRRLPGQTEMDLVDWMAHHRIPGLLILTKTDKLSRSRQLVRHRDIAETLGIEKDRLLLFSAKTRQGKDQIWEMIERLITGDVTPITRMKAKRVTP